MINVTIIPVLKDNYAYLLEADNGETAIVDPGEAGPAIDVLEQKSIKLDTILCTHHHADHIAGCASLKEKYGAKIIGPEKDAARIPGIDIGLTEDSDFSLGGESVTIFETPGHTTGGICYYFPESTLAFTGDTLFSMGCGRLFEGTPEQMWESLQKIMTLPDDIKVYCGHEYTQDGGNFSLHIEPDNEDTKIRMEDVIRLRKQGKPTIPSTIALEKKTNPFLRAGSAQRFGEIRKIKDDF